jgi:hypothetical protein
MPLELADVVDCGAETFFLLVEIAKLKLFSPKID